MVRRTMETPVIGVPAALDFRARDKVEVQATGPDLVRGLPRHDKMNFEGMIKKGENPDGFTAQTNNGTARAMGTGWNKREPWSSPEVEPDPTRPAGRNNRTGE
jgi:hypothetical protein